MPTKEEYAQLSTRVYLRTDENRTPVAGGWSEVAYTGNASMSGFSAGVYQNGTEIVIAYTGTNEIKGVSLAFFLTPLKLNHATSPTH